MANLMTGRHPGVFRLPIGYTIRANHEEERHDAYGAAVEADIVT